MKNLWRFVAVGGFIFISAASVVFAQAEAGDESEKRDVVEQMAVEVSGCCSGVEDIPAMPQFSLVLTLAVTSGYWGRGVFIENQDIIFQPTFAMEVKVYENPDGFIHSFSFTYETFNSIDGGPSGSSGDHSSPEAWNETDQNLGISFGFAESFTFNAYYSWIISPNNSYDTIEEIDVQIAYDDSSLWAEWGCEDFAGLQPVIAFAVELKNQTDGGAVEGSYFEFGIAPSFTLYEDEDFYFNLTIPMTIGLSLDNYYEDGNGEDHTFGFFDVGLDFALPLNFVPNEIGEWEFTFGVHALFLGEAAEELNDPQHDFEVIGTAAITISF